MTRRRPTNAEICGSNDSLQTEFAWIITTGIPVPAVSIKAIDPWLVSITWLDMPPCRICSSEINSSERGRQATRPHARICLHLFVCTLTFRVRKVCRYGPHFDAGRSRMVLAAGASWFVFLINGAGACYCARAARVDGQPLMGAGAPSQTRDLDS